jgi:hypothetical protein
MANLPESKNIADVIWQRGEGEIPHEGLAQGQWQELASFAPIDSPCRPPTARPLEPTIAQWSERNC